MEKQSVVHNTFVIERTYPATPERVFAAFADPAKKRRWFVEGGSHDVEHYEMDFREGGKECAGYRFKEGSALAGIAFSSEIRYHDILPNRRMVFAQTMSLGGKRISATLVTIEILPAETGTELICTHQGAFFEGADGPEMREAGWRKLLDGLTGELAR